MSNEPERGGAAFPPNQSDSSARKSARSGAAKAALNRLLALLRHNIFWKILALFFAVCLWAGLITQDPTLTRERVFSDVPITVSGADTLRKNGLIVVTDLTETQAAVRLRVDVPQREYNTVSGASYAPRVDLSRIKSTGEQTLVVLSTSTTAYGTVKEVSPSTITVQVEEYVTRYRVPVTLVRTGTFPEGFVGTAASLDPPTVAVSGPRSLVERVSRAMVSFDLSNLPAREGTLRTGLTMTLTDLAGEAIQSSLLQITSESVLLNTIIVEQSLYPTRQVAVSDFIMTSGSPADGYEVKNITLSPDTVTVAGASAALDSLNTLFADQAVSVRNRSESFYEILKLHKPADIVALSSDSVTVTVEIGARLEDKAFRNVKVSIVGIPEGMTATPAQSRVNVTVTAPALWITGLKTADIVPYLDVTGLSAGEHALPVLLSLTDSDGNTCVYSTDPMFIDVKLSQK